MKILALDSSGLVASVAIVDENQLVAEYTMNHKKTHSQTLVPMLDEVRNMVELDLSSVDAIALAAGPGSFTGLRIGSATAKGLGLALDKPIIPVPTVDALAYNLYGVEKLICPLMDARRNQVYTGIYTFERNNNTQTYEMKTVQAQCAVDIQEILQQLNTLQREVVFLGDGVPVFAQTIEEQLNVPYSFAPATCNRQRAACVAELGKVIFMNGGAQSAAEHAPDYLRLSQAEREKQEREQAQSNA